MVSATHGTAKLAGDGQTLLFTPEMGYVGEASITMQADDGYATGTPMVFGVNVSGAKLLAIRLAPLPSLITGQSALLHATGDFEDERNVDLSASGSYLTLSQQDLSAMGYLGADAVAIDDVRDVVRAKTEGAALIQVSRIDSDGRVVRATAALNIKLPVELRNPFIAPLDIVPDVYPGTLTLIPNGTRQLKVNLVDVGLSGPAGHTRAASERRQRNALCLQRRECRKRFGRRPHHRLGARACRDFYHSLGIAIRLAVRHDRSSGGWPNGPDGRCVSVARITDASGVLRRRRDASWWKCPKVPP